MTIVEDQQFTCHVCGRQFAGLVVLSTNTFAGTPSLPPALACPGCGTPPRHRIAFSPGTFLDILFEIVDGDGCPTSAIDRLVRWCTHESDIDAWQQGFAKTKWDRIIRSNLRGVHATIARIDAALRSDEPYGEFNTLQHDAAQMGDGNEAMRRFAAVRQPEFESWPQMHRELRAMMDADPSILEGALEVVAATWGGLASRYQRLANALGPRLDSRVASYFEAVRLAFRRDLAEARQRIASAG